jgi:hypothetical protein
MAKGLGYAVAIVSLLASTAVVLLWARSRSTHDELSASAEDGPGWVARSSSGWVSLRVVTPRYRPSL